MLLQLVRFVDQLDSEELQLVNIERTKESSLFSFDVDYFN